MSKPSKTVWKKALSVYDQNLNSDGTEKFPGKSLDLVQMYLKASGFNLSKQQIRDGFETIGFSLGYF